MTKISQRDAIRSALEAGDRLTSLDALHRFGCLRLGARIFELRREGLAIESHNVQGEGYDHHTEYKMRARP